MKKNIVVYKDKDTGLWIAQYFANERSAQVALDVLFADSRASVITEKKLKDNLIGIDIILDEKGRFKNIY